MNNRIVTFHILLAAQFALVAANIIMNIKIGLFSMILILLLTTTCLIQLNNDEQTNWKPGRNIMTYLFVAWFLFYFLELLNPNNVMEAWNINITPYTLIGLICAFIVPIVIRTKKDIELLLIVWSSSSYLQSKDIGRKAMVSVPRTFIFYFQWEVPEPISSGRASAISPALQMRQITAYIALWQP